jgi:hyperosmotically inducible periplasmic protein
MGSKVAVIGLALTTMLGGLACSQRSADQAKRSADATVDAGKVAANKVAEVATATGEAVSDGWITAKLKAKFADEVVLNGNDITVDTKDHAVTLTGSVLTPQARTRAVEIANGTEGVRLVVNHIVVK